MHKISTFLLALFAVISFAANSQVMYKDDASKFEYAKDFMLAGKYSQAIDYCSEILSGGNRYPDVYRLRASAYRAQGDFEKAVKDYTEAIQGKRDAQLFQDRGQVNFCLKNFEKAEQDFNEAIRLIKENTQGNILYNFLLFEERGRAYHQMGQYRDAVADFTTAIENGSVTASIEIMASLFRINLLPELKSYALALLGSYRQDPYSMLQDSSLFEYVTAMYQLSEGNNNAWALVNIDKAIDDYKSFGRSCYQGLLNDMYCVKASLCFLEGQDSLAYELYKKAYNANSRQAEVKPKLDYLKIKIGIDVTPPEIALVNPLPEDEKNGIITTAKSTLELYGKVQDSSGVVSLTVNNKSISKIEADGIFVTNLDLQAGANPVVITAIDKFENKSEKKFSVNLVANNALDTDTAGIPELFTYANYHAVLIGEKDYEDPGFPDLTSPANDVADLKNILATYYEFDEKNITTFISSGKVNILDSLTRIASSLKEEDNLLVFYAGHGDVKKIGNQITGGYIIPSDAKKGSKSTYINSDDLKSSVEECAAKHVLFIVDACFGGTLFRSVMDDAPPGVKSLYQQKSRKFISSGNSEEVPDGGAFIQHLKDRLKDNTDHYLTTFDLFSFLLKYKDGNTTPQFGRIDGIGDLGGDFIFLKK